jgi:hypothetical protein
VRCVQLTRQHFTWIDIGGTASVHSARRRCLHFERPAQRCDHAGEVCLAAFGHYIFLKVYLPKILKTPIGGVVGPAPKCVAQTMLLCPAISRLFITYGTCTDTSKPGAPL